MKERVSSFLLTAFLGVVGHSGCIAACLSTGTLGLGVSCSGHSGEFGHPLSYMWGQMAHLLVAILMVGLYLRISSDPYRLLALVIVAGLLSIPMAASFALFTIQAIFVVQATRLILSGFGQDCCQSF